jgi:hypothetical protein
MIQVIDEPVSHSLLISLPLDDSPRISHILFGDYSKSFTVYGTIDERMIKWCLWTMPHYVKSIAGDFDINTKNPVIHVALENGTIVDIKQGPNDDYGNAIPTPFVKFALRYTQPNWIHHFGDIQFRIKGNGTLTINTSGEDGALSKNWVPITLTSSPGREFTRYINFKNEKCSVRVGVTNIHEWFDIEKMSLGCKPLWASRNSSPLGRR